mgnify:CR=1 FL=1
MTQEGGGRGPGLGGRGSRDVARVGGGGRRVAQWSGADVGGRVDGCVLGWSVGGASGRG